MGIKHLSWRAKTPRRRTSGDQCSVCHGSSASQAIKMHKYRRDMFTPRPPCLFLAKLSTRARKQSWVHKDRSLGDRNQAICSPGVMPTTSFRVIAEDGSSGSARTSPLKKKAQAREALHSSSGIARVQTLVQPSDSPCLAEGRGMSSLFFFDLDLSFHSCLPWPRRKG